MPRRSPAQKRRKRVPIQITRLGLTCFRVVATYDPELSYKVVRVAEPRSRMAVFVRRPARPVSIRRAA